MAKLRYIKKKITSLARLIATPIPIYTVTRAGETVVKEKYDDNGVLVGQTQEGCEFWITRDGQYLRLTPAQDTGPRGDVHVRRAVNVITEDDLTKALSIPVIGQAVLMLVKRRRENAQARVKSLEEAERELADHLKAPAIIPCNTPLPSVLGELEEEPA